MVGPLTSRKSTTSRRTGSAAHRQGRPRGWSAKRSTVQLRRQRSKLRGETCSDLAAAASVMPRCCAQRLKATERLRFAFSATGVGLMLPGFPPAVVFHNRNRGKARCRRSDILSSAGCHPRHRQTGGEIPVGFDDRHATRHGMGLHGSFFG